MISRRDFVLGVAAATSAAACSRNEKSASQRAPSPPTPQGAATTTQATTGSVKLLEWEFEEGARSRGTSRAVILVPTWGDASARYPVLIAIHGRGESVKPPARGALGWAQDYKLTRAFDRLRAPPLGEADYEGFVDPARMAKLNASLKERPFGGVIVACPHVVDVMGGGGPPVADIADFMTEVLLPRVQRETPALAGAESTGIDGVSMGGALALRIGLTRPESFGAVGSLQAAITEDNAVELVELARLARAKRPGLKLRLLTSYDDYFRDAIRHASLELTRGGVEHDFTIIPGPHDYPFNRGPGSIEMLTWHDRMLSHGARVE